MLCARAAWIALRRRGLALGSPPPVFAAIEISFDNLLKTLPRFASIAPLNRLTFDHLLCPAIHADSMQLLIEPCEFPNNTSPREWLARKNCYADLSATTVLCQSCAVSGSGSV